jgi:hypothetical protein
VASKRMRAKAMLGAGSHTLRGVAAVAGDLMLLSRPVPAVLTLLWVFWEDLVRLTLRVCDDHEVSRAERGFSKGLHADVSAHHAHLTAARKRGRLRHDRAGAACKRWSTQAWAGVATVCTHAGRLAQKAETVALRAATMGK